MEEGKNDQLEKGITNWDGDKERATESGRGGIFWSVKERKGVLWVVRPTQSYRLYLLILFIF